jgi:hypothetical protein
MIDAESRRDKLKKRVQTQREPKFYATIGFTNGSSTKLANLHCLVNARTHLYQSYEIGQVQIYPCGAA